VQRADDGSGAPRGPSRRLRRRAASTTRWPRGRGIKGKAEKATQKDVQKHLQKLVDDLSEASDKFKGKKSHKARNRVILLTGDARRPLQPVDGPGDARLDHGSGRRQQLERLDQLDAEMAADAAGNGAPKAFDLRLRGLSHAGWSPLTRIPPARS
jgi:hypothetical protein